MKNSKYKDRLVDKKIETYLNTFGAVCIEGPKWCGKTWTSAYHSNSEIYMGDPANNFQNRSLAKISPKLVLEGERPKLIDEWQEVPELWDAIRYEVDKDPKKGQFILTGSATPNHKGILHSGAGRIARIKMKTMSLYESGDSSGKVSLKDICDDHIDPVFTGEVDLNKIIECIIRGGWPASINMPIEQSSLLGSEYLNAVVNDDVFRIDGIKRDTHKMWLLLRSLARNESTTVTNKKLKNDIKEIDCEDIDIDTVSLYLDIFNRLFLIDNQPPYSEKIRSSVRLKQAEKRHFCDPSLACSILNITPKMLINDLETLGFLFEALCERDLKIYADTFNGKLFHYQDYEDNEMDAVIEMQDGSYIGFEIKLGANQIDEAADNLLKIKNKIKSESGKVPKVLCVICGMSNAAYKREDGVYVVPITALKD